MNTTHYILRNRVSTSALSIALIACSTLWHIGTCIYYATSGFGTDWSATPLLWMLIVTIMPAICFGGGIILMDARKHSKFTLVEYWALVATFLPVTAGTLLSFWAVKVLLTMASL